MVKIKPVILVDTREQEPFIFKNSEVATLETGDYTLKGYEKEIAIERKAVNDAINSVLSQRERFEREMERSHTFKFFAIVIEGDETMLRKQIIKNAKYHHVSRGLMIGQTKTVINTYRWWPMKHGIHVYYCKNHKIANKLTEDLLLNYDKYRKV